MENKTINTEGSLMRLKKQELVNIILRKDNVEVKHNEEIKELKANLSNCEDSLNYANMDISKFKEEIKHLKDMLKTSNEKYDKLYRKYSETQSIASAHKHSRDEMAKNCVDTKNELDNTNKELAKYKRRAVLGGIVLIIAIVFGICGLIF